jgi:hypothetical protein
MLTRLCLFFFLVITAASNAADEPPPTLRPNAGMKSAIEQSFRIHLLRDTHDPTLVEVMIQIDKPPIPMAFDVSLRFGNKTLPVGPMAWDQIRSWSYDVDIPVGIKSADLIFTANPAAVRRLQIINPFAVHHLTTIWEGTAVVKAVQISQQSLAGMEAYPPAKPELLPQFFADELIGHSVVVDRFRQDFDAPAAQQALENLLKENPHDPVIPYNLGCIAAARTNWQRAIEYLAQARNAPGSPVADEAQHQLRWVGGWVAYLASRDKEVPPMFTLATMYENGWGPARDLRIAKRYYRNAANAGDARAMTRLGALYAQDLKAATDPKAQAWYRDEMLSMYRQAAKLNDPEAKAWLAQHDAH